MYDTTDTSTEAEEVQMALLRSMSGRDRIRQTCVLTSHLRQMAFDAVRKRFPEMECLWLLSLALSSHTIIDWEMNRMRVCAPRRRSTCVQ